MSDVAECQKCRACFLHYPLWLNSTEGHIKGVDVTFPKWHINYIGPLPLWEKHALTCVNSVGHHANLPHQKSKPNIISWVAYLPEFHVWHTTGIWNSPNNSFHRPWHTSVGSNSGHIIDFPPGIQCNRSWINWKNVLLKEAFKTENNSM